MRNDIPMETDDESSSEDQQCQADIEQCGYRSYPNMGNFDNSHAAGQVVSCCVQVDDSAAVRIHCCVQVGDNEVAVKFLPKEGTSRCHFGMWHFSLERMQTALDIKWIDLQSLTADAILLPFLFDDGLN